VNFSKWKPLQNYGSFSCLDVATALKTITRSVHSDKTVVRLLFSGSVERRRNILVSIKHNAAMVNVAMVTMDGMQVRAHCAVPLRPGWTLSSSQMAPFHACAANQPTKQQLTPTETMMQLLCKACVWSRDGACVYLELRRKMCVDELCASQRTPWSNILAARNLGLTRVKWMYP